MTGRHILIILLDKIYKIVSYEIGKNKITNA